MTPAPVPETGLAALAARYDVFLVDQFGVLHDGSAAYPGAVEALAALKQSGATVVLLSNSGKRSGPNEERLAALGFRLGSWDLFLTSGEVAWRMFGGAYGHPRLAPGTRVMVLARGDGRSALEGLPVDAGAGAQDADLVLLSGSEGDRHALDAYREMLAPAVRRGVPLVCTNPDKVMLTPSGPKFGAGRIAELYEEMGGRVAWIGKPFPQIYRAALEELGGPDPARVIGIGDSVEHDVAGAKASGVSAALVRSGILADADAASLEALYARHQARPDFVLPAFA
jgi:HAD superfamily hydrolase (TIGR01459 family)